MQKDLILQSYDDLKKAITLLKASVKKFKPYKVEKIYSPKGLEYSDSLSFRFEKSVELVLNVFKGLELFLYAKGSDTLRDRLLSMQKLDIVDSIDFWMEARILRNKIAHSYLPELLREMYDEIIDKSQIIFESVERLRKYLNRIGILS